MSRCLDIASQIEKQFNLERTSFDIDLCASLIDTMLPDSSIEAEERAIEFDTVIQKIARPDNKPGLGKQLRNSLGLGDEVELRQILLAAIERIERLKTLEKIVGLKNLEQE